MGAGAGWLVSRQLPVATPDASVWRLGTPFVSTVLADGDLRQAAAQAGACAYVLKENLFELPPLLTDVLDECGDAH